MAPHKVLRCQNKVGRPVGGDLPVTLHQLVQLQAHEAGHSGRAGGDGRDDPPGDALALWSTRTVS